MPARVMSQRGDSPPLPGPPAAAPPPGSSPPVPAPGPAPASPGSATPPRYGRLGTFAGVFTPVVLSVLGVVMFMRAGTVVGYAGLWLALVVLLLSVAIVTLTTLSLSAIATNIDVRAGGIYYMVSRVLGPDFGGSIGVTLYLALAVNVAFQTIGFTEALFGLMGDAWPAAARTARALWLPELVSTAVITGMFVLTYRGGTAQAELSPARDAGGDVEIRRLLGLRFRERRTHGGSLSEQVPTSRREPESAG